MARHSPARWLLVAGADDDGGDVGRGSSTSALAMVAISAPWRSATLRSAVSSAWNKSQPPKSSMISLYLISERFSSGMSGSGWPSHRSLRKPPATEP